MTINYTTLTAVKTTTGSIANWVNRSDLPTSDILTEAQSWIYQRLRVREMETRDTLSFATSGNSVALPSRFLDPIAFVPYGYSDALPYVEQSQLGDARDEDGNLFESMPSRWTIIGETAYVDVKPLETFAGILNFYKQPADLAASTNETNFLTTRYPSLLRFACMAIAYQHMKDTTRTQEYSVYAEGALQEAMRTNEMYRRGQYVPRT